MSLRHLNKPRLLLAGLLILLIPGVFALAGDAHGLTDDGGFVVDSGRVHARDGQLYVDVKARLELTEEVLDALLNGVGLTIIVETELLQKRSVLWDKTVASTRRDYQISYHSLSRKYLVSSINGGESGSFRNLDRALDYIGTIRHIPLGFVDQLEADEEYVVRARLILAVSDLPAPLHLPAYFKDSWQLDSDWYVWPLGALTDKKPGEERQAKDSRGYPGLQGNQRKPNDGKHDGDRN